MPVRQGPLSRHQRPESALGAGLLDASVVVWGATGYATATYQLKPLRKGESAGRSQGTSGSAGCRCGPEAA